MNKNNKIFLSAKKLGLGCLAVSFQRVVRRTDNSEYAETLRDAQLYQDFYERVSKSVFIEAQKI